MKYVRLGNPVSEGIVPVSRFSARLKSFIFVNPVSDGIVPVSWLPMTLKSLRFVNPVSEGIGPVSWLPAPLKSFRFGNPASGGIGPVSWLFWTWKCVRVVNPASEGIVPVRLFPDSRMSVTWLFVHVTPYHVHSVPAAPFQLVLVVQRAPPVLLYRAKSASRSVLGDPGPPPTMTVT